MSEPTNSTPLLSSRGPFSASPMLWRCGAAMVAAGMIAGAFGTHVLKKRQDMTVDKIHAWETASSYTIYNGLALLLVSLHPKLSAHRFVGPAIGVGGLVFSCTIMALVLNRDRFRFLGPITPLGGTFMIAGYIAMVLY